MDGYFLSKSRRMKDKKRRGRNALSFVIHTIMCCQLWCFSKVAFLAHTFISSFFARVTVVIACEMSFPETETPFTRTTLYQYQRLNECPETEAKKNKIIIPWLTRHPLSKLSIQSWEQDDGESKWISQKVSLKWCCLQNEKQTLKDLWHDANETDYY